VKLTRTMSYPLILLLIGLAINSGSAHAVNIKHSDALPSEQLTFFDKLKQHCGKAYLGKLLANVEHGKDLQEKDFSESPLIMYVRRCSQQQLQIPFYVGDDASRTWLLSKTTKGLRLQHDHRYQDGAPSKSTMYGGHTDSSGSVNKQSFPVDQFSIELFKKLDYHESVTNTWFMQVTEQKFTYELIRDGREFTVEFDLTQPISLPPTPWGYSD